jgi:hypothetical protein
MQNRIDLQSSEIGAFVTGALDVLFAFSLALECKGLLTRAEIVDALTQVQHHRSARTRLDQADGRRLVDA